MIILQQPSNYSNLMVAYRPIVFLAQYTGIPPVAYCDVYFDDVYYKTLSKTQPEMETSSARIYKFDIADACQEYLKSEVAPVNGVNVNIPTKHFTQCYCKFRTSSLSTSGFIDQETPIPVQATSTSIAINGGGTQSNSFTILNSVLQHEHNQDIKKHLSSYVKCPIPVNEVSKNTFLLSHRPYHYKLCKNDSDYFSIVSLYEPKKLCVELKTKDGNRVTFCKEIKNDMPYYAYQYGSQVIGSKVI